MTSGQKTAVSLLTSVILFFGFAIFVYSDLFSVIDARFFEPSKIEQIQKHLDVISQNYNNYIKSLEDKFGKDTDAFLKQKSVLSYIESSPKDEDVRQRSKLSGDLFSQTPGLLGMRLIDKNGVSVHYSTFSTDILSRTEKLVSYKNYSDAITLSGEKELSFEKINSPDTYSTKGIVCKNIFDGKENRIVISFPFYDSYSAYRGTFVFYINANDFNRVLLSKKLISFSDTGVLISDSEETENLNSGFVFGIPQVGKNLFEKEILSRWKKGLFNPEKIVSVTKDDSISHEKNVFDFFEKSKNEKYWILVSSTKTEFGYVAGIYPDEVFVLSDNVKTLLLGCIFITLFLVIFLTFNLRQDQMMQVRQKIKRFQIGIVNEYLKQKESVDWKIVSGRISERRQDFTNEIIKSLGKKAKKHSKEVNELINRSWEELLTAMNVQSQKNNTDVSLSNSEEIKKMLQELLSSGSIKVQAVSSSVASAVTNHSLPVDAKLENNSTLQQVEQKEEVIDAESVEELEDVESIEETQDAESVETLEEVLDVENVEEAAEVESVEELEEISEVEAVEEVQELTDFEEVSLDDISNEVDISNIKIPAEENINVAFEDVNDFLSGTDSANIEDHNPETELQTSADVEKLNKETAINNEIVDEEDNLVIDNFSVEALDYSELDRDVSQEQDLSLQENQNNEKEEAVSLDEFGIDFKQSEDSSDLTEEIGFGSVSKAAENNDVSPLKFDIEPKGLNFGMLDEKVVVKKHSKNKKSKFKELDNFSIESIQEQVQSQAMEGQEDIVELSDSQINVPFSFTNFSSVVNPAMLQPQVDVIQEDDQGVFVIHSEGQETTPANDEFKKLVDSVLRN